MNLSTNKFFNSTDIHVSSRMNEYLKKNFGYEVEGDIASLKEAKKSLELEQVELKKDGYMNQKYMENMLMIETIGSLLKAHNETDDINEERVDEIIPLVIGGLARAAVGAVAKKAVGAVGGAASNAVSNAAGNSGVNASKKSKGKKLNAVKEDDEEKGPDHYRWKNDSQLSIAKDRLEASMKQLEHAIQYRAENSHLMMRGGDKAGTGDLYNMHDKLKDVLDNWDENTEYYGM
jgi:hypothetical protein